MYCAENDGNIYDTGFLVQQNWSDKEKADEYLKEVNGYGKGDYY